MSRSLDKDLLAHLKADDSNKVFGDISTLLTDLPTESGLLEIEFLGKEYPLAPGTSYLRDGLAVGIPKLRLAQAFFVARQILQNRLDGGSVPHNEMLAATAVLLLMDPEHLTAANIRKRLLVSALERSGPDKSALRQEKQFVDSLVTSRLHRHTKSPTLWSHRRWLFHLFAAHGISIDIQHDIKSIVMIAGERHPRNYTAWHHARILLGHYPKAAELVAIDVKEFCLRNHTDISGWSFLSYAIFGIEAEERRRDICSLILADVLKIADSLGWINESVWVFLRNITTAELVNQQQFESCLAVNKKLASVTPKESDRWRSLDSARRWCEEHRLPTVSNLADT
ncbi:hypothetical protein F4821DRAFT_223047 [Hypoxylon rubiginosum]|uniref:Uncharacterized protein n=1 Tax=Hypoxylon rubiginosum TaxID=110542 RepID=A0ACC0DIX3_9PEZI|nr:hypothetical protein F4821DRAFT_223047 [Hypoxylon rubiginosum]